MLWAGLTPRQRCLEKFAAVQMIDVPPTTDGRELLLTRLHSRPAESFSVGQTQARILPSRHPAQNNRPVLAPPTRCSADLEEADLALSAI